jgi:TolB-like protein/Flp pilus assembly protein TadD
MPTPSFIQRLKERKLGQWTLAYLAGAWVIYEASGTAVEVWGFPLWIAQSVHVLLFFGLFVTLVLAWYHGEKGRQRVSGPELLMLTGVLVVAGVALTWLGKSDRTGADLALPERDDRPWIAVLPFDNLSPNSEYDFFAGGVLEDLTKTLDKIPTLGVLSRTSVERFQAGPDRPVIREIAQILQVDFLTEGSVRISGDSVRVTIQLIDGRTDEHLWSADFDKPYSPEDYYRIQAEIAQEIAASLRTPISPQGLAWLEAVPTGSLDALEAFMKGKEAFFRERRGGFTGQTFGSDTLFGRAVDLDPEFALAHAALGLTLTYGSVDRPQAEQARRSAQRALALEEGSPDALIALARYSVLRGQEEDARHYIVEAADLAPNHALVAVERARLLFEEGDLDAAISVLFAANPTNPADPLLGRALEDNLIYAHRYDEAQDELARQAAAQGRTPRFRAMATIHLLRGDTAEARLTVVETESLGFGMGPYLATTSNYQRVVTRFLTPEQRQTSFDLMREWRVERGHPLSCQENWSYCMNSAIHEGALGRHEVAEILWDSLRASADSLRPTIEFGDHRLPLIYMGAGAREAALETAQDAVDRYAPDGCRGDQETHEACYLLARVHTRFGELDDALDILAELLPAPSWLTVHILEIDPIWEPLRDHPRFQALLEEYADDVEH